MNTDNGVKNIALLNIQDVVAATSISKATIYRLMKIGRFPERKALVPGGRRVGWSQAEVSAWADDPLGWGDDINF